MTVSKFRLFKRPPVTGGKCISCGNDNQAVVDTGATVDFIGAVYVCVDCITECAHILGYVKEVPEDFKAVAAMDKRAEELGKIHDDFIAKLESSVRKLKSDLNDSAAPSVPGRFEPKA